MGLSHASIVLGSAGICLALIPDALVTPGLVLPVRMSWPVTVVTVRLLSAARYNFSVNMAEAGIQIDRLRHNALLPACV